MKNNKKFILAAGAAALGLVAATGVTSGFAWFATNADVTVASGQIKASTDQSFLLVKEGGAVAFPDVATWRAATPVEEVTFDTTNAKLQPSAYGYRADFSNPAPELNATNAADPTKWYTATSSNWDSATKTAGTEHALNADDEDDDTKFDFSGYVLKKEFTFGLAEHSASVGGLKLTSLTITNQTVAGLSVIFSYGTSASNHTATSTPNVTLRSGTFSDSDLFVLTAYFYIDGENAAVKSSAAQDIKGTISFTVTTIPAQA